MFLLPFGRSYNHVVGGNSGASLEHHLRSMLDHEMTNEMAITGASTTTEGSRTRVRERYIPYGTTAKVKGKENYILYSEVLPSPSPCRAFSGSAS